MRYIRKYEFKQDIIIIVIWILSRISVFKNKDYTSMDQNGNKVVYGVFNVNIFCNADVTHIQNILVRTIGQTFFSSIKPSYLAVLVFG